MAKKEQPQADSLADEGKSLYQAKKYLPAAASFAQAAEAYQESGQIILAAEMRNNQSVALLLAKKPRQALEAVQGTSELFLDAGQKTTGGMALANQATALKELGETEDALDLFTRAADLFQEAGEEQLYLETMQSVSGLKMQSRNLPGALFSMQKGLEGIQKPTWRQKLLKKLLNIPDKLLNR